MPTIIDPNLTVLEITRRYPGAGEVLARYGLDTCCGGAHPLRMAAIAHNIPLETVLAELSQVVRKDAAEPAVLFRPFLKTSFLFTFTGGTTLGVVALIVMGMKGQLGTVRDALIQAHGHVQLYGWVALFIMGVAYHVLPRVTGVALGRPFLPKLSLFLMAAGVVLRALSQTISLDGVSRVGFFLGGNLEVAAVLLFVSICAPLLDAQRSPSRFERFLAAGNLFFALATFIQVGAVSALFAAESLAVPAYLESPFLAVFLLGFVAFWIFGISVKTLPGFLGLRPFSAAGLSFSYWSLCAGVPAWSLGQGLLFASAEPSFGARALTLAGAILAGAGLVAFPLAMRFFEAPTSGWAGMEADRGLRKFVRAAYGWLIVSASMALAISASWAWSGVAPAHAYTGAFRHALTVGFVTTMMVGMGSRILPVFSGASLRSPRLREIAFWLILAGCAMRVAFQSLSEPFGAIFLEISGASGPLELAGMILFAWNVWPALSGTVKAKGSEPAARRSLPVLRATAR